MMLVMYTMLLLSDIVKLRRSSWKLLLVLLWDTFQYKTNITSHSDPITTHLLKLGSIVTVGTIR